MAFCNESGTHNLLQSFPQFFTCGNSITALAYKRTGLKATERCGQRKLTGGLMLLFGPFLVFIPHLGKHPLDHNLWISKGSSALAHKRVQGKGVPSCGLGTCSLSGSHEVQAEEETSQVYFHCWERVVVAQQQKLETQKIGRLPTRFVNSVQVAENNT